MGSKMILTNTLENTTMKVFQYNVSTGTRGNLITEIQRPEFFQNKSGLVVNMPHNTKDTTWFLYDTMSDRTNSPVEFSEPVCFCMGQFTVGETTDWHWGVYVPAESDESFANRYEYAFFA